MNVAQRELRIVEMKEVMRSEGKGRSEGRWKMLNSRASSPSTWLE